MIGECEGKEWFTWVQACQCCALAVKTTRLSCVSWPIKDVLLLCWKTFFSCWITKALASCHPSCSTSRYSALIFSLIFPSSAVEVELWEKYYREVKDNKINSVQSQTVLWIDSRISVRCLSYWVTNCLFMEALLHKPHLGILKLLILCIFFPFL